MDHCQHHSCCIMKMWCISFPYNYLSSPPRNISKKIESNGFYKCKRKTNPKAMKRLKTLEWTLAIYCCVLIVESFCGISSITASAKHIKTRTVDDNIRLLSYLDNENHLPTASLDIVLIWTYFYVDVIVSPILIYLTEKIIAKLSVRGPYLI